MFCSEPATLFLEVSTLLIKEAIKKQNTQRRVKGVIETLPVKTDLNKVKDVK